MKPKADPPTSFAETGDTNDFLLYDKKMTKNPVMTLRRWVRCLDFLTAAILLWMVFLQIRSFKSVSLNIDWDNYVQSAQKIKDCWGGPGKLTSVRGENISIGYPLAVAGFNRIVGFDVDIHHALFWGQALLLLVGLGGGWWLLRQILDPLTGLLFLGLFATPNFYVFYAAIPMSDFFFSLLWIPCTIGILAYLVQNPTYWWPFLPPLVLAVFLMGFVRTGSFLFLVILVGSVFLVQVVTEGWGQKSILLKLCAKGSLVLVFALGGNIVAGILFSFSPQNFYSRHLRHKVITLLPPATTDLPEQRIEDMKAHINIEEGERLEDHHVQIRDEFPENDVFSVWQRRLLFHPLLFAWTGCRELIWKSGCLVRNFIPFQLHTKSNPHFGYWTDFKLKRVDDSSRSRLFRRTGIWIKNENPYWWGVVKAIGSFWLVGGTFLMGLWIFSQRWGEPVWIWFLSFLGSLYIAGLTANVYSRYLVPWAPLFFATQAAGMAYFFKRAGSLGWSGMRWMIGRVAPRKRTI